MFPEVELNHAFSLTYHSSPNSIKDDSVK